MPEHGVIDNSGFPPIVLPDRVTDIELFAATYMRHRFKDEDGEWFPCAKMHRDFFWLWNNPKSYPNVVYVAPRGYYKSSFGHIGTLHDIVKGGPPLFREHLIIAASEPLANQRILDLQWDLTENELLLEDYGENGKPMIGKKWTESEISVPNGVKVVARGRGGSMRGLHPDAIWIDDIEKEGETGKLSPTEVDNIIRWLQGSVFPMVLSKRGRIFFMGNFLGYDSALYKAFYNKDPWGKKGKWFRTKYAARTPEGKSTWLERFSNEFLSDKEGMMTPLKFGAEMMNEPMASENPLLLREWFRYFEEPQVPPMMFKVAAFDPAQSLKEQADYSAWCVIGADCSNLSNQEAYYTLDAGRGRWDLDERVRRVFDINERYRPDIFRIENNAFQNDMVVMIEKEAERRNVILPIERVQKGRNGYPKDKYTALDAVSPLVKHGNVRFRKTQVELIDELLAFPSTTHDDYVDAFSMALDRMKHRWHDKVRQYAQRYYKAEDSLEPAIPELGM